MRSNLSLGYLTPSERDTPPTDRVIRNRVAEAFAYAKKIEDEIFRTNRPQARKYEIKRVKLAQLKGKVTLNGKPLAGATVAFLKGTVVVATGKTDENGSFRLATGGVPGVSPGVYTVVISRKTTTATGTKTERIPAKYSDPKTSGLSFTVSGDGENRLVLKMKS